MSIVESFDDFNSTEQMGGAHDLRPFQFREHKDKKGTLDWLNENFEAKMQRAQSRFIVYRRYQAYYKNVHWRHFDAKDSHRDIEFTQRKPRHAVNFVFDQLEDRVAQMDRLGNTVACIPANQSEQSDLNNAKACKILLNGKAEELDMEKVDSDGDRVKFLFGHSFTFNIWNPDIGPLDPAYEKAKKSGNKIPKLNKEGKPTGKFITKDIHIGDMDIEVLGPDRVLVEMEKKKWKDVNELDRIDYVNKWRLKEDFPKVADEITETNSSKYFEFNMDDLATESDLVLVKTFFHKPTKYLPEGAEIKYTDDVILEWNEFPYDDGELPCVPDTDIDIHEQFYGRSFIQNIEQMQRFYNNVQSAQARNEGVASAPKWVMPKGSAKVSSFSNELIIMEYQGAQAPQLITPRSTNPQSFEIQDRLESKIKRLSRTSDVARGELPPGVTATSAIRLLEEQSIEMIAPTENKRKRRILSTRRMMLSRMQQFYKKDDKRMIRLLGKNNDYLIKSFERADFSTIHDVTLENTSSLSNTKSGKISDIIDLNMSTQTDPIFRREDIVQMLNMGLDEAFVDGATVAVTAAQTVVEEMLYGNKVPEPQKSDNFMVYYTIMDRAMQSFAFRQKVSQKIKDVFEVYMTVLEGMMEQRAKVNAKFAQQLSTLDNYPMYFKLSEPLAVIIQRHMLPMQGDPMQGGADTTKTELSATKEKK